MPLTTNEKIRELGNLSGDLDLDVLSPHISKASLNITDMIGATVYEEAQTDVDANQDDKDRTPDTINLVMGETYMALAFSVVSLNTRSIAGGGLVTSVGFADGKSQLLSMADLKTLQKEYYEGAMNILRPYILDSNTFEEGDPGYYDFLGGDISLLEI